LDKKAKAQKIIKIIRDGKKMDLHQSLIYVGDIVIVEGGMEVPADGIVLEANELTVDESAMTGEADPLHKNTLPYCI